jgi:Tfp pilus assembly protein PilV
MAESSPMNLQPTSQRPVSAFSLMEVMIALGIFFMAVFTILALVSNTLRNARALQRIEVEAAMVAADLTKTNRYTEGSESGDFGDFARDYSYRYETYEAATNGLWRADIVLQRRGLSQPADTMSILLFSPESSTGPFGGGPFRR